MASPTNELLNVLPQNAGLLDNAYFQNVASEFIALFLIIACGYLVYRITGRRCLLRFFGIQESKRIVLYLSNLSIVRGGARGAGGLLRNYSGPALAAEEASTTSSYQRLFNFVVPGVDNLPGFLRWILLSDVELIIRPSPNSDAEIERVGSIIAFGSPGYNEVSNWIESKLHSDGRFQNDNSVISLPDVPGFQGADYGFVQRTRNPATGQFAFYVAGLTTRATVGSAYFLVSQWRYLARRYPSGNFCVVLRVATEDGKSQEILCERGESSLAVAR